MGDWQTFLAIGALAVAGFTLIAKLLDNSLSVREHEEFKEHTRRDVERIEKRIELIEQTRPSSGELKGITDGLKDQLRELKTKPGEKS